MGREALILPQIKQIINQSLCCQLNLEMHNSLSVDLAVFYADGTVGTYYVDVLLSVWNSFWVQGTPK